MRTGEDSDHDDDSMDRSPKRIRRNKTRRMDNTLEKTDNTKFERGLLRFNGECWKKMEEKEKEFVRDYNATTKHGDPIDKVILPHKAFLSRLYLVEH